MQLMYDLVLDNHLYDIVAFVGVNEPLNRYP